MSSIPPKASFSSLVEARDTLARAGLRVSLRYLTALCAAGRVGAVRLANKWFVRSDALDALLANGLPA